MSKTKIQPSPFTHIIRLCVKPAKDHAEADSLRQLYTFQQSQHHRVLQPVKHRWARVLETEDGYMATLSSNQVPRPQVKRWSQKYPHLNFTLRYWGPKRKGQFTLLGGIEK